MKELLKDLGLSANEIAVYQALVKTGGSSSAGDIIKITDLHRNLVYDAFTHLKNKGLTQEIEKGKKKFFVLKNPERLAAGFKKQVSSALALGKIVSSLSGAQNHEVAIYEGGVAWQEAWQNMMQTQKAKSTFYTLGMAGDKWVKLMGDTFIEYEAWALKNKITDKIVSQKHLQKEIEAHQSRAFRDIRYIDIDLPAHVSIEIFDDRVLFEIYDEPATIIEIKSMALVKTLRAYFDTMWKMGK